MRRFPLDKQRALPLLAGLAVLMAGCPHGSTSTDSSALPGVEDEPPLVGTLRLSAFGETRGDRTPSIHAATFVVGPDYAGMEDNDLRGFLDGNFKYAWNQPGQSHVRVGRRGVAPRYGEHELFRVLQRWGEIVLPPFSVVREATVTLEVEVGPPFPVRLLLYEVKQDWDPGHGGTLRNNVSPPVYGEVWWNGRGHEVAAWGLPGVGYASDSDPGADTGESFLAETTCRPSDRTLVFRSEALAAYATRRLATGAPLLLLLKLSDYHEDLPHSMVTVYSANQGDSRNVQRRPRLTLLWESEAELESTAYDVRLEHGRGFDLPRPPVADARYYAWSFEAADAASAEPRLEMLGREGASEEAQSMPPVLVSPPDGVTFRVSALRDPVTLGRAFETRIHDTWIRTAAPEEQVVPCRFVSPTGVEHRVQAAYLGDNTWSIHFEPDEPGAWRYVWTHHFDEAPFESAEGRFDAVIGDRSNARAQLERFLTQLEGSPVAEDPVARSRWMIVFSRLERATLQLETPESFSSAAGAELQALLNRIRARLGEPVPNPLPMVPDVPPPWAQP